MCCKCRRSFKPLALQKLGLTAEQVQANANNAQSNIIAAALIIIGFAAVRGVFAFLQSYNAERLSQSVAFDIRNDIFSKIQRLSFSYHDKNQTGQLMVRATDDVEKVRLFIGQGLLLALQSVVLLLGTLDHHLAQQLAVDAGDSAHSADGDDPVHGLQHDRAAVVHGRCRFACRS